MRRSVALAIVAGLVIGGISVGAVGVPRLFERDQEGAAIRYAATILPSARVDDVVLMLPFPSSAPEGLASSLSASAPGWTGLRLVVAPSDRGDVLIVRAASADAGALLRVTAAWESDEALPARDAHDGAPLLAPRRMEIPAECVGAMESTWDQALKCTRYASAVWAEHAAGSDAVVSVTLSVEGTSAWWWLGWNTLAWREDVAADVAGGAPSWSDAEGRLIGGSGSFR